jgi:hypothetical protein
MAFCLLIVPLVKPGDLRAQDDSPTTQLWANMTLGIPSGSPKLFYEIDFEPKVQVEGPEKWTGMTINTLAALRPLHWLDLTGDVSVDYTVQSNDLQTFSIVPRIGAALHILSNVRETGFVSEKVKRLGLATLLRLEWRNFWYSGDAAEESYESSWRFRVRFDIRLGLNRADIGPGYRLNRGWRFEVLYMFEETRNTLEGDFERSNNVIDLRAGYNF